MNILHKLLILSIILSIGFVSCDGITDIQQPGRLPADQALQTVDDMALNLPGLYGNLDVYDQIYMTTIRTDEAAIGPGNGGQGLGGQYQFVLNSSSAISSTVWNSGYSNIDELNRFIVAAQEIEPESNQQARYNDLLGQAYAMRAFEYFKLLSFYSEDLTDNSSLGVPTFTEIQELDAEPTRNTTGETFDRILSDIDSAQNLIDPGANSTTRFTQDALTALEARIATYRQNYGQAETLSQQLIDNYSLADSADYVEMYRDDTNGGGELIFKLARSINDPYEQQAGVGTPAGTGWIGNVWAQVTITQGAHYQTETALVDAMNEVPNDVRPQVNILSSGGVNYVAKYAGNVPGENQPLMNDQKIFRVSEMYLINAEAKAHNGDDLAGAALRIQQIQNARKTTGTAPLPSYANEAEAFQDILEERRVELAFEGHRWFDLRRMGPTATDGTIDRDETVSGQEGCANFQACDGPVPGEDHRYVLPIPLGELNVNQNIQQNPGYGGGS